MFPLGTVLFPGVVLPLHVFEPRYRDLTRRLMAAPEGPGREFGVVSIRQGWEVGEDGVKALYEVGCTAELRQVASYPDGRYDIVTVGRRRFRLHRLDTVSAPYPNGEVEWLPDTPYDQDEANLLSTSVGEVFQRYVALIATVTETQRGADLPPMHIELTSAASATTVKLPTDPATLSHLVAASAPLPQDDRQALLAEVSTIARLRRELRLLKREATMLRRLRAVPIPLAELRAPLSLN